MSMRPKLSSANWVTAFAWAISLKSQLDRETMVPPACRTRASVSSLEEGWMSQPTTLAPSAAKRSAAAWPMLPPVPVIMATLSSSRPVILVPPTCVGNEGRQTGRLTSLLIVWYSLLRQEVAEYFPVFAVEAGHPHLTDGKPIIGFGIERNARQKHIRVKSFDGTGLFQDVGA